MIKIGITGGMGSGKSFVSNVLRQKGYIVFDCDKEAKILMTHNEQIIKSIKNIIGEDAYIKEKDEDGNDILTLNKQLIANFIFSNIQNRNKINMIVHQALSLFLKQWAFNINETIVFIESAILFESGFNTLVDITVMVYADEKLRINRCLNRNKTDVDKIKKRINTQMDQKMLANKVDYILLNNEYIDIEKQIDYLLNDIH